MNIKVSQLFLTLVIALAVTGCSKQETASQDADAPTVAKSTTPTPPAADPHDPCRLLDPKEAEAVLGAPLAGAPYRGGQAIGSKAGVPQEDGDACWYYTSDNKNFTVQAEWTNAGAINAGVNANLAKAEGATKGMLKLQDGTELVGDWDEAKIRGCCIFVAMQGDSMVEIDFGGSLTTTTQQAADLANKALARLTKPLDISGQTGLTAGLKNMLARYSSTDPCSLWTAEDITKLLGAPKGEPERSDNTCTYVYTNAKGNSVMFMTMVTLRNGYRGYRTDNGSNAGFEASINAIGEKEGVSLKASTAIPGPWEAAIDSPIMFNTVKRDAQIAVRQRGMSREELTALIGHGYAKIEAGAKK